MDGVGLAAEFALAGFLAVELAPAPHPADLPGVGPALELCELIEFGGEREGSMAELAAPAQEADPEIPIVPPPTPKNIAAALLQSMLSHEWEHAATSETEIVRTEIRVYAEADASAKESPEAAHRLRFEQPEEPFDAEPPEELAEPYEASTDAQPIVAPRSTAPAFVHLSERSAAKTPAGVPAGNRKAIPETPYAPMYVKASARTPRARETAPLAFRVQVTPVVSPESPPNMITAKAVESGDATPTNAQSRIQHKVETENPKRTALRAIATNPRESASAEILRPAPAPPIPQRRPGDQGAGEDVPRKTTDVRAARPTPHSQEPATAVPQASFPTPPGAATPPQRPQTSETPMRADAPPAPPCGESITSSPEPKPAGPAATPGIVVRIARPDASPVDLRVVERAGHVRVDVRTPDTSLQTSLRQDLGVLVNSLERAGFHAEAFTPRDLTEGMRPTGFIGIDSNGRTFAAQGAHTQDRSPQDEPGSSHHGEQPSQQQHHQRRQPAEQWMEILEKVA